MADIPWDDLMDAAKDSDFAPIPQGDYDVKIIETEATKSSTDKPMWKITATVLSGPHEGRKLWTQQTLTMDNADALNVFFRQMAAAGLTREFFATKPTNSQIADALLGRMFRAKVTIREWQGVPRNNIKQWNPVSAQASMGAPGGPPPPPGVATPPAGPPPPPAAAAPPSAAAATTPPAATPPPPATQQAAPAAAAPPPAAAAPPPPASAEAQPVNAPAAAAGPGGGGADQWVVQDRQTGSTEPPPF